VNAQERSAAGQMILHSGASCLDQLGRARVSGIPDIDDQQSAAPWLGEATFHLLVMSTESPRFSMMRAMPAVVAGKRCH
jgi:hypothetical protein